jgi:hypothetical protein
MTNESKSSSGKLVGVGVALGLTFGSALGAAFHNVGLGVALGLPIGAAIGAALERKNDNSRNR